MSININHLNSLVVIAGISGAGRSSALRKMSDMGFYVIDNLPISLVKNFIEHSRKIPKRYLSTCLILETDTNEKVDELLELLSTLKQGKAKIRLIFLDSDTETILKRFSETRRPHPNFDPSTDASLEDTIQRERERLEPIKYRSNLILDTSKFSVHELRKELRIFFEDLITSTIDQVRINFISFGFKYGTPSDCDLIIDIRFLPNPHFVGALRERVGLDKEVSDYVLKSTEAKVFLEKYTDLLYFLLPNYANEGKSYLNIGVGCTGGKHRSVAIVEELKRTIQLEGFVMSTKHRDIDKL